MASVPLTDPHGRAKFFNESVLINLHYWQTRLEAKINDVATLDHEYNGMVKAISFAFNLDQTWPAAFDLIVTLSPFMERRGYWDTWQWVLTRALETANRLADMPAEVTLSALLARLLFQQSRFKEATARYRRTICLARQIGDRFNEARACTNLGYHYIDQGYWYRAEVLCCYALKLFEELGNDHGRAHTENHLGILYTRQHYWEQAQYHLERACEIWETTGDQHGLMRGFINLSGLYTDTEQFDQALRYLKKALHQARLIGEEINVGRIYVNLGRVYRSKQDLIKAEAYARKAETIFRQFSNPVDLARVWDNLGVVYFHQGKWQEAIGHLEKSLETWRNLGNRMGEIEVLLDIVEYELFGGDRQQAVARLREVEQLIGPNHDNRQYRQFQPRLKKYRHSLTN